MSRSKLGERKRPHGDSPTLASRPWTRPSSTARPPDRLTAVLRILLEEFLGDLRAQKTRSLLTLFAMIWGTIAVVLLLAFGEGLKIAVESGLLNAGERMFMIYGGETSVVYQGLPRGRRVQLVESDLELLRLHLTFTAPSGTVTLAAK